jgi:hypothetical protein
MKQFLQKILKVIHRSSCPTDIRGILENKIRTLAKKGKICSIDKVQDACMQYNGKCIQLGLLIRLQN